MIYRTEKSKAKNVPAYYIFNNDEMVKLIEVRPKNVEELKGTKY